MRFPRERIVVMESRHELVPEVRELLQRCQNEEKTGWLSIKLDQVQHVIFLSHGNFVGGGMFVNGERQAAELDLIFVQLASQDFGIVSFYETGNALMKILLSTFHRKPEAGKSERLRSFTPADTPFTNNSTSRQLENTFTSFCSPGLPQRTGHACP